MKCLNTILFLKIVQSQTLKSRENMFLLRCFIFMMVKLTLTRIRLLTLLEFITKELWQHEVKLIVVYKTVDISIQIGFLCLVLRPH